MTTTLEDRILEKLKTKNISHTSFIFKRLQNKISVRFVVSEIYWDFAISVPPNKIAHEVDIDNMLFEGFCFKLDDTVAENSWIGLPTDALKIKQISCPHTDVRENSFCNECGVLYCYVCHKYHFHLKGSSDCAGKLIQKVKDLEERQLKTLVENDSLKALVEQYEKKYIGPIMKMNEIAGINILEDGNVKLFEEKVKELRALPPATTKHKCPQC